ncbi:hypothetical protein ASZ90_005850 [hydrocarbon metagenome]|uniref:Uncharacterized protein n=1 Tax=hydrocarbon metagenome TaxID=938273 RepID=A0A0W8FU99_9ZZZZ
MLGLIKQITNILSRKYFNSKRLSAFLLHFLSRDAGEKKN